MSYQSPNYQPTVPGWQQAAPIAVPAAARAEQQPTALLPNLGLLLGVIVFPVGLVISVIGLVRAMMRGGPGKRTAVVGIAVSILVGLAICAPFVLSAHASDSMLNSYRVMGGSAATSDKSSGKPSDGSVAGFAPGVSNSSNGFVLTEFKDLGDGLYTAKVTNTTAAAATVTVGLKLTGASGATDAVAAQSAGPIDPKGSGILNFGPTTVKDGKVAKFVALAG